MARPNTPNKNFNESVSSSLFGIESAKKQVTCILYSGPYFRRYSGAREIVDILDSQESRSFNETNGVYIPPGSKRIHYLMIDRKISSTFINRMSNLKNIASDKYEVAQLEMFADELPLSEYNAVMQFYEQNPQRNISNHELLAIMQGLWASKNCYIILDEVLGPIKYGVDYLQEMSFVLEFPMARSAVAGSYDHVELVKTKYLGNDFRATSSVISGLSRELNMLSQSGQLNGKHDVIARLKSAIKIVDDNQKNKLIKHKRKK